MIDKDYRRLLCRPEHIFDEAAIDKELLGKKILITGAGGSIGSALTRRICQANPLLLYVLGHGEDSIFQLQQRLLDSSCIRPIIADAYSHEVFTLLETGNIDLVFHTAAHKHVGLMESNPRSAFANNTQATIWLARKCEKHNVRFVYLSTDKAVKPTTVMGASKKLAEAWVDANCSNAVTIRLGNVLGSAGSLVEIIERRRETGHSFNLAHRDMARHFVTVKEAVGLILTSGIGLPGKYTLYMGLPRYIEAIVRQIAPSMGITISNKVGKEKLVEDLREDDEGYYDNLDSPIVKLTRDVKPELVSAVLEIIEDHANSGIETESLGRLMVNIARKI